MSRFVAAFRAKPLLLDAGMGTRLMARGLDHERDDPSLWSLDHPEAVSEIHRSDVMAGSDAVFSNTFGANRFWLDRFHRKGDGAAINRNAVELAREAVGVEGFVVGSIGPTCAEGGASAYREQADWLAEAGADALILETHIAETAMAGLSALAGKISLPVLVSLCSWPGNVAETARRLVESGAAAVGTNCGTSPGDVLPPSLALAGHVDAILAKPSGSFPPNEGQEAFAVLVPHLLEAGVRLIGGCCGTDQRCVATMRAAIDDWAKGSS